MQQRYDVAVVGNGMMGASAARHLAEAGLRVAAAGPGEPANWQAHNGVFASHYDEARITRIIDPDPVWSKLAARAIAAYVEIAEMSGIPFHYRAGCLRVSPLMGQPGDTLLQSARYGAENGAEYEPLNPQELAARFPYLHFPENAHAIWETGAAGYVNPRALVAAQIQMATAAGAALVQEEVTAIEGVGPDVRLTTAAGRRLHADRVLIAGGGFTNHLLPRPLDLHPRVVSVLLAELDRAELARLRDMPAIIYRLDGHPVLFSIYSLPPVRYPDGKRYFKIGGQLFAPNHLYGREELVEWFHGDGDRAEIEALTEVMYEMIPNLHAASVHSRPCVVTYTGHERPYVDSLDGVLGDANPAPGRLFVAAGGCGGAAKSAVEIGRLAAKMVAAGAWDDDLPAEWFRAR